MKLIGSSLNAKVEFDINDEVTLYELLEIFELFLKANGYVFEGHLDFIENED